MKSRMFALAALACVFLSVSLAVAQTTHYVDNLGDCAALAPCHPTITDAVNAAAPSDSIEVFPGVYHEAVVVGAGKDNIVLRAQTIELMPVIAAPPGTIDAVTLSSPGVQVLHFVLEAPDGAGVTNGGLLGATSAVIQGNRIKASKGITLQGCRSSAITDNSIVGGGISVIMSSNDCSFEDNTVNGGSIQVGVGERMSLGNVVRRNVLLGGDIVFPGTQPLIRNTVELNRVWGGGILVRGVKNSNKENVIRHNIVRSGQIELAIVSGTLGANLIESNFVSDSSADGIGVYCVLGGSSVIRDNTSVESAGCDINDTAKSGAPRNTWEDNRFLTRCGAASQ